MCSASTPRLASLPVETGRLSRVASSSVNGSSTQPRLGAKRTRPSSARTAPGTATPTPRHRVWHEALSVSSIIWATDSTTWATSCSPRWWPRVRRSRTSPPRPTSATAIRSTPTSTATTTLSSLATTRCDGRPRPPTTAVCSVTRPSDWSSPVSPPIVLRFSPSCRVSTARVVGPWVCTVWRMARRLARRSSSAPTPVGIATDQPRPVAEARRRLIASTLAASSSTPPVTM